MLNRLHGVFASLEKNEVRYLVIGGIAAVLHGVPRATFDLEILVQATPDNAARLLKALHEAGLGTALLTTVQGLLDHEISVFEDYVRIDVQTRTPGIHFDEAWQNREVMDYHGQKFFVASRKDLIASKRAVDREVDLEDVRLLEHDHDQPEG